MPFGSIWPWKSEKLNSEGNRNSFAITDVSSSRDQAFTSPENNDSAISKSPSSEQRNDTSGKTMEKSIATMPETMNCSQAFDLAMACGGLGGSFNGVYRYGHWRDCSKQWADWRFCMSLGVHNAETKKQMVQEHYWKKEQDFRDGPNSENIWEERNEKITTFFERDPDKDGIFDGHFARAPEELEYKK